MLYLKRKKKQQFSNMRSQKQYSSYTLIAMGMTFLFVIATFFSKIACSESPENGGFWMIMSMLTPLFIVIDIALLIIWLLRKHYKTSILVALAIVINLHYVFSMIQLRPSADANKTSDFKIATLNTFGFRKFPTTQFAVENIAHAMSIHNADIICLQEYVENKDYPYTQIAKLFADRLPYSTIEGSQAIFSRFPITSHRYRLFEGGNNDYMVINLLIKGKPVRIISVHLQSTGISAIQSHSQGMSEELKFNQLISSIEANGKYRAKQAREIRQIVDSTSIPTIIAGDFNDLPSSYTYHIMKTKMRDGFKVAGHGFGSTFFPMHNLLRIDYILSNQNLKCISYSTLTEQLSDHKAVQASFRLAE